MRSLNLWLISFICACALMLTLLALPTLGHRPLAHWALNIGACASALLISLLYLAAWFIAPASHERSQVVVLSTYLPTLLISLVTGALWGTVGHVVETEGVGLATALHRTGPLIYIGYLLTLTVFSGAALYLLRARMRHESHAPQGLTTI